MRLPVKLMNALSITDTAPHASDYGCLDGALAATLQLITTATLAGSWKIEVKVHPDATAKDVTADLVPVLAAVTSGGSNQTAIIDAPYHSAVATFTASSGSGTASVFFNAGAA